MFYDDYGDEYMGGSQYNQVQANRRIVQQPPPPQFDELGVPLNLSPNTRRTRRAAAELELRRKTQERQQWLECLASGLLISFLALNVIFYKGQNNCGNFRVWLNGSMGIYICDLIMCMNQLMQVKKRGRENLWLILLMIFILAVNTGWYIWGNILYFQNYNTCIQQTDEFPNGQNPGLGSAVRFMIYVGYITMCKCLMVTLLAAIGIPCLIHAYRNANRPQWTGAAPDLMKRLAKGKFEKPEDAENQSAAVECCVCLEEFKESDTVITLPCNSKHVFHESCIKSWLESNNSCPLCKAPITEDALRNQNNR